jgi:hypothetical protein
VHIPFISFRENAKALRFDALIEKESFYNFSSSG